MTHTATGKRLLLPKGDIWGFERPGVKNLDLDKNLIDEPANNHERPFPGHHSRVKASKVTARKYGRLSEAHKAKIRAKLKVCPRRENVVVYDLLH